MSVYIEGMEMPISCAECRFCGEYCYAKGDENKYSKLPCPLVSVPEHGRLIDAGALRQSMYHEAFETDSPMQRWDSGCWIRYKMFERAEESAPTIIPADKEEQT